MERRGIVFVLVGGALISARVLVDSKVTKVTPYLMIP